MGHTVTLDGLGARSFVVKSHRDEAGVLDLLPAYSTDLNACATAEKHLRSTRPDLWRAYINALAEEASFYPGTPTLASMERFATASAEARCRAMLAVMNEKAPA